MNGPIRKVAIFVSLLMAALLVNLTWISVVRTPSLIDDPRNRRVRDAEFSTNRGTILVGNTPVAQSNATGEGTFPYQREYPEASTYSSITGWYSYDFAASELESSYNAELSGTASTQFGTRVVDLLTGRTPQGADLQTSIDADAQKAAVNGLGDQQGAAVAINYKTGEILALVSTPTYDPGRLATLDLGEEKKSWDELLNAEDEPLKNRAVREVFPPGSTFKLVVAAAALEDGMIPSSELAAPDSLQLPGSSATMSNSTNCGGTTVTLQKALETSCNTAFGQLGMDLGADSVQDMAEAFGFNHDPGIDMASADSRFPTEIDQAQTALSSIGQFEVAASPLQMVQVAATIANDGVQMEPHVVSQVVGRDLQVLSTNDEDRQAQPMSASNASLLRDMMVGVVENGTGQPAAISGLTIGGKTGTAESAEGRAPYAWFVGFAKELDVAVAVFVQSADVEQNDISGGRVAAPVFKAIVESLR